MRQFLTAVLLAIVFYYTAREIKHARAHDVPGRKYHGFITAVRP